MADLYRGELRKKAQMWDGIISSSHSVLSVWESKPANDKRNQRVVDLRTSFEHVLMAVTWYVCHTICLIWQYSHSRVGMVVADGPAPI